MTELVLKLHSAIERDDSAALVIARREASSEALARGNAAATFRCRRAAIAVVALKVDVPVLQQGWRGTNEAELVTPASSWPLVAVEIESRLAACNDEGSHDE